MQKKAGQQRELGQCIVTNHRICYGEPVFKETRKLIRDCIEMAAQGLTIDELASCANLPREAISEALHFAAEVLQRYYTDRARVGGMSRNGRVW